MRMDFSRISIVILYNLFSSLQCTRVFWVLVGGTHHRFWVSEYDNRVLAWYYFIAECNDRILSLKWAIQIVSGPKGTVLREAIQSFGESGVFYLHIQWIEILWNSFEDLSCEKAAYGITSVSTHSVLYIYFFYESEPMSTTLSIQNIACE